MMSVFLLFHRSHKIHNICFKLFKLLFKMKGTVKFNHYRYHILPSKHITMCSKKRSMAEQKNSCTAVNTTKSCRGSVRFNDELIIHSTSTTHQESSSITWLTQNDYSNIQNGIFMTLHAMNMMAVNEEDNVSFYNPSFCSRGLEDYSTQDKGCLKNYVTTRRKEAVHAVLQEQESQRMEGLMCYYDDVSIREAYESNSHTLINTNNSISMGRNDSEEALKIYAEQHRSASPMPSQTQTQLQLQPPFSFSSSPKSVMNLFQNSNVHEKKWNFQQQQ